MTKLVNRRLSVWSFILVASVSAAAFAQSGTRSLPGARSLSGTRFIPVRPVVDLRLAQEQAAAARQQVAEREQERLLAEREEALFRLATPAGNRLNRHFNRLAYAEARQQYVELRKMLVKFSDATQPLDQPFRLTARELDRQTQMLNWPNALKSSPHIDAVEEFQSLFTDSGTSRNDSLLSILDQLSAQLAERVKTNEISVNDYALGKKFITGLRYEVTHSARS